MDVYSIVLGASVLSVGIGSSSSKAVNVYYIKNDVLLLHLKSRTRAPLRLRGVSVTLSVNSLFSCQPGTFNL